MSMIQTAERSSGEDASENVIFQRHLIAYKKAAELVKKNILEIGCGEGYGIKELLPKVKKYICIDKYESNINFKSEKLTFIKSEVPPLDKIKSDSLDFVVTFQVIEHIEDDKFFVEEIFRVLKPGGKLILTTPNKAMTLSRNPWHVREYTNSEMKEILSVAFTNIKIFGVYGNQKVMNYYQKNKESVNKIMKWDIFNLQYRLPRKLLQIPYDILNRYNRVSLKNKNSEIVDSINFTDYSIVQSHDDKYLDHFCVATK